MEGNESGHSMVCIGHGKAKDTLKNQAYRNRWISWENRNQAHPIINSADFYEDYVVVDDNQPVYQVRSFDNLSLYPNMRVENLAVPLYKRMFLDAPDATSTIRSLLNDERLGLNVWVQKMNTLMNGMDTSSGLKLSLRWRSKTAEKEDQLDTRELVELLKKDYRLHQDVSADLQTLPSSPDILL